MKAAQIKEYGAIDKVEVREVEKPAASKDQVLVEVHAASLNPVDTAVREGYTRQMVDLPMPITLGGDIAGVVAAVGEDITTLKVGDKVYGQALALFGGSGALAEYATTSAKALAVAPSNIDFKQAASLPLVGASVVQGLTEHLKLQKGQKIFIHGAAGGIGAVAVQIAKHLGSYVAASAKGKGTELVKSLGADEVIDTDKQDFSTILKDYDGVLNLVADEDWEKLYGILKSGATVVSMAGQPDEAAAKVHNITVIAQMTDTNTDRLNKLRELVEQGIVVPHVGHVYPLSQIREAFEERESGGINGKIVIEVT